eukprot:1645200-Pleurochrysis_carterae.AAC.1
MHCASLAMLPLSCECNCTGLIRKKASFTRDSGVAMLHASFMNLLLMILNTVASKCANNFNFSRKKSCNLAMSWGQRPS